MYSNDGILGIVKVQSPILRDLGVTDGVLGATSISSYGTVDGLKRMADVYNQAHRLLRAVGVNLSFHTHEWEPWPVPEDGRMGLDLVLRHTDPAIKAQIDIGWKEPLCYVEGGDAAVAASDLRRFGWGRA